jgi:hypothetical protein
MCEVTADGDIIVGRVRPKNNPLIRRSEVGKSCVHNDLPSLPADYTFGAPLKRDPEGAGEVMLSWQSHATPTHKKEYDFGRDFITLNRQSLGAGCLHPRDVADFRKTHEARIKPKTTTFLDKGVPDTIKRDKHHIYGAPSPDSEHVADLIQNRYELEWVVEQKARAETTQLVERENREKKRRSHSPTALVKRSTPSPAPHPKEFFTLKQFRDVPSRYFTPTLPDIRSPTPNN